LDGSSFLSAIQVLGLSPARIAIWHMLLDWLLIVFLEMYMRTYRGLISRIGIPMVGLLALSACSGGGGDGAVNTVIPPTPTIVSGTAAKGLVKQARVLVCRIVNGTPEADASCASGTSGNDGSFTVGMSDGYMGPAMIKVMAGTASMMLDETTGTDIPYNMTMRAMVPAVSAATTVYVTPFSEMAANAMGTTAIDADKIRQAMATVQTLMTNFGVDLTVKPMMDLKNNGSDAAMMGKQANMVQQLTRVMMAAKNANSLKDSNGVACNTAGTSAPQQILCAMNAMAGVMTGVAATDPTRAATVFAALTSQNVTAAYMPIIKADGTLDMEMADMTSSQSMQAAMQRAGMTITDAANAVNIMMRGMH